MKKSLNPRTIAAFFGIAIAVLSWISMTSFWSTRSLVTSFDAVTQGSQVLDSLQYVETLLESAESSVRGFVITGRGLDGYRYARLVVPYKFRQLDTLDSIRPSQRKQLKTLNALINDHLAYLGNLVEIRQSVGASAAASAVSNEDNLSRRSAMAHLLSKIEQDELTEVAQRRNHVASHSWQTKFVLMFTTGVSLLLIGWVFVLLRREMNERRQAESATVRTETFLNSIIERIPYMILVKEARHLRLTHVNKAAEEWIGKPREDLLNSNEFDWRNSDDARTSIHSDRKVLENGKPTDIPEDALKLGESSRILHTQKIPVPDENGEPAFLLTISEDITLRKQAEHLLETSRDAAIESARMKSEFIANMSHEIRTPLAIISGMNDLLLGSQLTPDQKKFAGSVRRAAEGLMGISRTLLDFSKIETGVFALERQDVNPREIVENMVAMVGEQAKAKGIHVVCLVANDLPPTIIGDGIRFRQVVTQLMANALKFTPKGEIVVRVTMTRQSDTQVWLNVRISDTGIGIDPAAQEVLFQPFRQADGSKTRRFGGTGLGLAVSKRIVELMGGHIGFESVVAQGSTFWFTVPFNKIHVRGPVVQEPSEPWTRARVLLIGENELFSRQMQQQLKTWSLTSEIVSTGQAALDLLRREALAGRPFPIVMLEMNLIDMDGVTFARQLQDDEVLKKTQLLILTSGDAPLDADASLSLGFSGSISKQAKPEELYRRLSSLIEAQSTSLPDQAA